MGNFRNRHPATDIAKLGQKAANFSREKKNLNRGRGERDRVSVEGVERNERTLQKKLGGGVGSSNTGTFDKEDREIFEKERQGDCYLQRGKGQIIGKTQKRRECDTEGGRGWMEKKEEPRKQVYGYNEGKKRSYMVTAFGKKRKANRSVESESPDWKRS